MPVPRPLLALIAAAILGVAPARAQEPGAAAAPEVFLQMGHRESLECVAASKDGRTVLSGDAGGVLILWDFPSGRQVRTLRGHARLVDAVALSPDGTRALSGSWDKTMKLWDTATGTCLRTFSHADGVGAVAFAPGGKSALSAGGRDLVLWDLATGAAVRRFEGHPEGVGGLALLHDGKRFVSWGGDGTARLWSLATGQCLRVFKGGKDWLSSAAVSPDMRTLAATSDDHAIRLWNVATGALLHRFEARDQTCLAWSPDGTRLYSERSLDSGGHEYVLESRDPSSGMVKEGFRSRTGVLALLPGGRLALGGSGRGYYGVGLWDLASGGEIRTFEGKTQLICGVSAARAGSLLLTGGPEKEACLWDLDQGARVRILPHSDHVKAVALTPDGKRALVGAGDLFTEPTDFTLKLWDAATGRELRDLGPQPGSAGAVALSADGSKALAADFDKTDAPRLWDLRTGTGPALLFGHTQGVGAVAISPDGTRALSGSQDGTMRLWDLAHDRELRVFNGHEHAKRIDAISLSTGQPIDDSAAVNAVAFSPDGFRGASGSRDKTVRVWDLATGRTLLVLAGHQASVTAVRFSPDGRYLLSGSGDPLVRLWDAATGQEVRTFKGHLDGVNAVDFSADSRRAFSSSRDGTVRAWDVATGRELAELVSFSDGEWIVLTPEGFFNASPGGARHIDVSLGRTVVGIDQFYARFYRPELVSLALRGELLPAGEALGSILARRPAPAVRIVAPAQGASVPGDHAAVTVRLTDAGGGIGSVNLYLNGSQVSNRTRGLKVQEHEGELTLSFSVPLVEGANEIRVVAFNRDDSMESAPAAVTVRSSAPQGRPDLHVLAVGIDRYRNPSITLAYAVADAQAFAASLRRAAEPLFGRVETRILATPESTTKEALAAAFADLAARVKPNDVFVFYDASHGTVDVAEGEERYYLLTSNVFLLSSRHLAEDALDQRELARLIGSVPAQKKLVVLDTCNAGRGGREIQSALLRQTRGLTDATAVKLLQRSIGSAVFSASSDAQAALEGYRGHGLFTYVLIEGLKGAADVRKDGYITILGLADYVEGEVTRLSEEAFKRQQTPTLETGANFPIGRVAN